VFYESFKYSFKMLHPQSFSPIHFAKCELQNTNTCKNISSPVMSIIKHQNHLVKWVELHFPYNMENEENKVEEK
jgi:hypothetical protein